MINSGHFIDHQKMAFTGVLLFLYILCPLSRAAKDYIPVSVCPPGAREWRIEAERKKCQQPTPDYLCAAIENWLGHFGSICTQLGLSPAGTCAVLNNQTHNLDSVPCKAKEGCPDKPYTPRELYRWPVCFADFYGSERTTVSQKSTAGNVHVHTTTATLVPEPESADPGILTGVIIVILIILIGALVIVIILDKRFKWGLRKSLRKHAREIWNGANERIRGTGNNRSHDDSVGKKDDTENIALMNTPADTYLEPAHRLQVLNEQFSFGNNDLSWKLTALGYYLAVTLKHHCGIDELKNVTVLFKTSLLQHFNESVLEELNKLNTWDDYQKLDLSLLYNLLRNVCKYITPPNRGWGYDPLSDDVSLGADIERIRSIWNSYSDGETEFVHLTDIFVRMIDRFGTISEGVKVQVSSCEKILSVELKPECTVHDKFVLTKAIKLVLANLEKENFVIVKGALGSGKSTCLKYVEEHYRGNQWEVKRKEEIITPSDLYVPENKKLLLCCDNLFGAYNRGQFASTSEIIEALENPKKEGGGELKVAIAIHDHVFDELQKSLDVKALQIKRVVVNFNEFSEAEMLLIFNDQRKRGHCARDKRCSFRSLDFRSLQGSLKENPGLIGDPLLSLLYTNFHELFTKKEAKSNIVRELCTIYQNMLENNPECFHVLVYIMMVHTHKLKNTLPDWATELGEINNEKVEQNVCKLDAFLVGRIDGGGVQMKHDIFSFALFKFCADQTKYQPVLLQHCQFSMIEEIMRPDSSSTQSEFCVILKEEMVPFLISRIVGKNLHVYMKSHPLMENLEFKDSLKNKSSPDLWKSMFSN